MNENGNNKTVEFRGRLYAIEALPARLVALLNTCNSIDSNAQSPGNYRTSIWSEWDGDWSDWSSDWSDNIVKNITYKGVQDLLEPLGKQGYEISEMYPADVPIVCNMDNG